MSSLMITVVLPATAYVNSSVQCSSAAYGGKNRNLTAADKSRIQQFFPPDVLAVQENVYMRPELTLFGHHPIAQPNMQLPQFIERFSDGCRRRVDGNLAPSAGEVSQESGNVESNHVFEKSHLRSHVSGSGELC